MRLTPKHVGMEISWGQDTRWETFKAYRVCRECDRPHNVIVGGFYGNYGMSSNEWRVRKPQSKRRKM